MIVNISVNFLLAFVGTLLLAGLAKWIAARLTTAEASRLVSFGFGCGYTVGKFSFVKPTGADISMNVAQLAGAFAALAVLWFLLFHRKNHAPS